MENKMVFKRVEIKYLLDAAQLELLWPLLLRYMQVDGYGRHTIQNIYYDTPHYDLIRTSLQKPVYKEKLRLRSYGVPQPDTPVFVELKKKYKGTVYKRREQMPLAQAEEYFSKASENENAEVENQGGRSQIMREIDHFMGLYHPQPKVLIAYDRVALFGKEDPELRLTLDSHLRWRTQNLSLAEPSPNGMDRPLPLPMQKQYLMELKIANAMPMWLARSLSLLNIYPASFSKYGACYTQFLAPQVGPALPEITYTQTGGIDCA